MNQSLNKTWVFDQSERAQGYIYIIKTDPREMLVEHEKIYVCDIRILRLFFQHPRWYGLSAILVINRICILPSSLDRGIFVRKKIFVIEKKIIKSPSQIDYVYGNSALV